MKIKAKIKLTFIQFFQSNSLKVHNLNQKVYLIFKTNSNHKIIKKKIYNSLNKNKIFNNSLKI